MGYECFNNSQGMQHYWMREGAKRNVDASPEQDAVVWEPSQSSLQARLRDALKPKLVPVPEIPNNDCASVAGPQTATDLGKSSSSAVVPASTSVVTTRKYRKPFAVEEPTLHCHPVDFPAAIEVMHKRQDIKKGLHLKAEARVEGGDKGKSRTDKHTSSARANPGTTAAGTSARGLDASSRIRSTHSKGNQHMRDDMDVDRHTDASRKGKARADPVAAEDYMDLDPPYEYSSPPMSSPLDGKGPQRPNNLPLSHLRQYIAYVNTSTTCAHTSQHPSRTGSEREAGEPMRVPDDPAKLFDDDVDVVEVTHRALKDEDEHSSEEASVEGEDEQEVDEAEEADTEEDETEEITERQERASSEDETEEEQDHQKEDENSGQSTEVDEEEEAEQEAEGRGHESHSDVSEDEIDHEAMRDSPDPGYRRHRTASRRPDPKGKSAEFVDAPSHPIPSPSPLRRATEISNRDSVFIQSDYPAEARKQSNRKALPQPTPDPSGGQASSSRRVEPVRPQAPRNVSPGTHVAPANASMSTMSTVAIPSLQSQQLTRNPKPKTLGMRNIGSGYVNKKFKLPLKNPKRRCGSVEDIYASATPSASTMSSLAVNLEGREMVYNSGRTTPTTSTFGSGSLLCKTKPGQQDRAVGGDKIRRCADRSHTCLEDIHDTHSSRPGSRTAGSSKKPPIPSPDEDADPDIAPPGAEADSSFGDVWDDIPSDVLNAAMADY